MDLRCSILLSDFRFVNIITKAWDYLGEREIRNQIRIVRLEQLKQTPDIECIYGFLDIQETVLSTEKTAKLVGVEAKDISDQINDNISNEILQAGVDMFLTLNSCPSYFLKLYLKVIYGPKSIIPILSSNIIKKSKNDFKKKTQKMFSKIASVLQFEHLILQQDKKGENFVLRKDILHVKGK